MTSPFAFQPQATAAVDGLHAACPVLLRRPLRPDADPALLPRYADDRWTLTAAMFEDHARSTSINWDYTPRPFVDAAKHVTWALLNETVPAIRHSRTGSRLSVQTIANGEPNMRLFLLWLDDCGLGSLDQVTGAVLDDYLDAVRDSDAGVDRKHDLLGAVRRIWACRSLLPDRHRLPLAPPWNGDDNGALVGQVDTVAENLTPRIADTTMEPLLGWALLFVQELSKDIVPAWHAYRAVQPTPRPKRGQEPPRRPIGTTVRLAREYAQGLRDEGLPMPGRRLADGTLVPDVYQIARVLGVTAHGLMRPASQDALTGVPIASNAYLVPGPVRGTIAGRPWRDEPIAYAEAKDLAQLLQAACFIVVAYLSGMRPGEALTLRRGCCSVDPATGLWTVAGKQWKGVTDEDGNKAEQGKARDLPWVVIEAVADAVAVLERLHHHDLLFPMSLAASAERKGGRARARTPGEVNMDLNGFLAWANDHRDRTGLGPRIEPDPNGPLSASRLRRTLAWFICRKPRGLVAGALQYGHLHTRITLGYAGSADSGFKDEVSFERFLARADRLADDERRLAEGEHVSGPAAEEYRRRVNGAGAKFAGRVLSTKRQAARLLDNPALAIYEGGGMTCVYDRTKAACAAGPGSDDVRRTPDLTDCRPHCGNIARTDRDVAAVTDDADELASLADDPLCPEPLRHRYRHALSRQLAIVEVHRSTRPSTPS